MVQWYINLRKITLKLWTKKEIDQLVHCLSKTLCYFLLPLIDLALVPNVLQLLNHLSRS